ncbi:proteasome subunit alpha type-5 [Tanacetum coccineum]
MDLKLCYNTFRFKEGENLAQTFIRYKALKNELVNDGIQLLKLKINTGFINGLPKKWLSLCQSLINANHVRDSELASLFDSLDDEEDTRSSQEYMNDLEIKFHERALLAKSKSSTEGLNSMLKNGPWFIRNHPHILRKWNPNVDLLKKDVGNVPVWVKLHGVPVTAFSEDGLSAIAMKLDTPLMLDSYTSDMCLQSWGRSSYAREECPKNIGLGVAKNLKKPSQTSRGVPVGPKVGFKPHKEYRLVPKKPTASSSDNDMELGTNGGTTNLVNNEANSSGSSFINVENISASTTPIIDKIREFEDLLISGQAILVDEAGNPLKKVECPGDYDSEDEVESVDNDMALSMASERVGFGTQSLLKQWRDSYGNGDYDEDPYDDDMYEGQDLSQEIQAICDNLDIREEVSSDDNEMVEVKVLMALANDESGVVGKESARNILASSGQKDLVIVKSSVDDTNVSKLNVERPWFSEVEGLILPNHDTGRVLPPESQKLLGAEPQTESHPRPKTIKSILKACSTRKSKISKDVVINETNNSSALAKGNKNVSASKRNSAPACKLKHVKTEDDISIHLSENCYKVLFYKQYERTDHRTCDLAEYIRSMNIVQHLKTQDESSSRSKSFKPLKSFPPCKNYRFNDHQSDDCHNYPICELYGSYDHDTKGHNRIISLRRGIKLRNPQFVTNSCETYGSTVHTTTDHNDIEWFRRGEALEAKKVESLNAN